MRKIFFAILITGISLFLASPVNAQVHVGLQINIGAQPVWGPVGYDAAQCYYFPDIEVYYSVPAHLFYYFNKGRWISRASLPAVSKFRLIQLL